MKAFKKILLKKLKQIESDIKYVNSGGCGIVAYETYKYLKNNFPENSPKLIYIFDHGTDIDVMYNIRKGIPDSPSHAVIKVGKYYYDSHGARTKQDIIETYEQEWCSKKVTTREVDIDLLVPILRKPLYWNTTFDKKQIPKIERIFND